MRAPSKKDGASEEDAIFQYLKQDGHTDLRRLPDGKLASVTPFAFTYGLMVGLGPFGYERRYCYEHQVDAREALAQWDGAGHPEGPWIKCKGRMPDGSGIDLLNPNIEDEFAPKQRQRA